MPHPAWKMARGPVLIAILLCALGFRCWGLTWGLHGATIATRPHPDEWTAYWLFNWFSQYHLNPCPQPGRACFFDWGTVFPYLEYALYRPFRPLLENQIGAVGGQGADVRFVGAVVAGRITSALLSTGTVAAVYFLGKEACDEITGLLAALIMALCALAIQVGHFATPDSATSLVVTLFLALAVRLPRAPAVRRFACAGLVLGIAVGTEYHLALLCVPLAVAWLYSPNRHIRLLAIAAAAAAVGFAATNPYALAEAGAFADTMQHTLSIRTVGSAAQYGDRWNRYAPAWAYIVRFALGYGVGTLFTIWMVLGATVAVLRRRREEMILCSWLVPYALLVTLSAAKFMRYSLPLLPVLAVLAAVMATTAWHRLPSLRLAIGALLLVALLYTAVYDAAYDGLFAVPDSRSVASSWVRHTAGHGTFLAFEQLPNGLVNLPYFFDGHGYPPCIAQFHPERLTHAARYVLLDDFSLEEHPRVADSQVQRFRAALKPPRFYVALHVSRVPTFLGLRFDIGSSPHDWRYPDHVVTVYRYRGSAAGRSRFCFPTLQRAVAALYTPATRSS